VTASEEKIADKIAAAAVTCFERYGVHRTSMNDVASAAGISRPTLYRIFDTRSDLLTYILGQRIAVMAKRLEPFFLQAESLAHALVEGSILTLAVSREDLLFEEIIRNDANWNLEQYLIQGTEAIQAVMTGLWGPLIEKARKDGTLRPGLDNDAVIDWIRQQHALLHVRADLEEAGARRMLSTFVVPSLLLEP